MKTISDMRVLEVLAPGTAAQLCWSTRPVPQCGADEVLIQVRASGLNHADLAQRAGRYPLKPGMSDILGLEVAGVVVACGAEVRSFTSGDRVCALLAGGGYAEYVCAPAVQCLPMPAGLDFAQAAVLPEAFATVWLNLFQKARLQVAETLLVHGAASGVGIAAIQLASALGARVLGTAGSADKCAACVQEGATLAIPYKEQDFEAALQAQKIRPDVVLDMVGGDYFARNMRLLAHEGRMVYIASLGGREVPLDLVLMMRKRITLFGSVLRPLPPDRKGAVLREMAAFAWPLLEAGKITPRIDSRFPVDCVEEAHTLMNSHRHIGKLVLEWQ